MIEHLEELHAGAAAALALLARHEQLRELFDAMETAGELGAVIGQLRSPSTPLRPWNTAGLHQFEEIERVRRAHEQASRMAYREACR